MTRRDPRDRSLAARCRAWAGPVALGAWLSVTAVWPVAMIPIGNTHVLWQPVLLLSLSALTAVRARRIGWRAATGQSIYLAAIFTLAGWLPWLRTIPSTPDFHYPAAYRYYLALYEAALAGVVGCQACWALISGAPAWWPSGSWSRPFIVAPWLLMIRAVAFGSWMSPLVGVSVGMWLAALQPWRRVVPTSSGHLLRTLAPWALGLFAASLVCAAGLRIYRQLGPNFPLDSDDGLAFYSTATEIAKDPSRIWSPPSIEQNMFTGYFVLMGLWFRVVGPHIPSWLCWQGVAAGWLAMLVYWLGRRMGSSLVGLVAAALVAVDHVLLHLMATLNMEVGFLPSLYAAVWLWASVDTHPPNVRLTRGFWAGLMFGVATLFRPTAGLLPVLLVLLLAWERPKLSWRRWRAQGGVMLAGFALPIILLLIRHRIAWEQWTFGGGRTLAKAWGLNYAWTIQDQHPASVGLGPWLALLAADPSVIWRKMIPDWWAQILSLWTHRGFGQIDLIQGLNYPGCYQAALAAIVAVSVVVGIAKALRRRTRADLVLLALPAYFTSLTFVYWVINTRYRAPFIPALYLLGCFGCCAVAAAIRSHGTLSPALSAPADPVHSMRRAPVSTSR